MADRLETLHERIDGLTDPDGDFAVVCPRSGKRPVPVRGASFATADDAETAVDLVREYRALLREVDPYLENVPLVATERSPAAIRLDAAADRPFGRARTVELSGERDGEWLRIDGAPVVTVREDGEPLPDDAVERQLRAKL